MGFEKSHPAVNLIYFLCVITGMIAFVHPVYLVISFLCACVYSIKRNGLKALAFDLALIPLAFVYAAYYASYQAPSGPFRIPCVPGEAPSGEERPFPSTASTTGTGCMS